MIDLAFNINFTVPTLDPRVTFSRALGTATRMNSLGLIEAVTADTPRFDYDPVTKEARGLLVEDQRDNLLLRSQEFNDAYWSKARAATPANATTSPDGSGNGQSFNSTNGQTVAPFLFRTFTWQAGSNVVSVFAKKNTRNFLVIGERLSGSDRYTYFNLHTGSVATKNAAHTAYITPFGNGWYRCQIVVTATAVTQNVLFSAAQTDNTLTVADDQGGIYIWGAQIELGGQVSSYIPTTTTALTRNADVATITGTNFSSFWQATRGGVLVRALPSTVSGTRPLVQFDDNTADNIISLRGNTTNPELYIRAGGVDQAAIDAGTIAANTSYRLAGTWNTNDCAANLNGAAPVLDTSATIPAVTQMRIGSDGTNYLNGHIEAVEYYDQRIINSALQVAGSPAGYRSIIQPIINNIL